MNAAPMEDVISSISIFVLDVAVASPFAFSQPGMVSRRGALILRLETASGLVGFGEGTCLGFQPADAAATLVRDVLSPMLIGRRISDHRTYFFQAFNRLRDFGLTGVVTAALSAVDIALWDVRGKALDSSVSALLGGRYRDDVEAYVTSFYSGDLGPDPSESAALALRYSSEGYTALKLKLGFGLGRDKRLVRAIRDAVPETMSVLVDANRGYGLGSARRLVSILDDLDVTWLEEPMSLDHVDDYRQLRSQAGSVLIAAGESEAGPIGFWPLMVEGAVDVLQPDLGIAGGFTGTTAVVDMALASGQAVCPHVWGTVIGQAAALQFIATIPRSPMSRGGFEPLFEFDLSDHPFRTALATTQIQAENGRLAIPDLPGLGVAVDEQALGEIATRQY